MAFFARENIAVPDDRKGQIVFKWPDQQIRRFSKAIVAPDEQAVFMYQGQVLGTLPPGRHQVDATELPFLGMFKDILTGGNAYRTELYFVGTRQYTDLRFGGRIDNVQDPVTGLVVGLRVFGEYAIEVRDPVPLILKLTGTVDVTSNDAITGWVAEQLLKVMRTDITGHIVSKGWPILGLAAYVPEMESSSIALANQALQEYGLAVARMGNFTVSLSDEDEATLKTLARDTAYSRLAGSYQQYAAGSMQIGAGEGMAKGGGGAAPAFFGAGMGLGAQAAQPVPIGPPPPPAGQFAGGGSFGGGGPAGAADAVACPKCQAQNPAHAKFCLSCGASLGPHMQECPRCHQDVPTGAKFCMQCGASVDPPPGAAVPIPT